MAIDIGDAAIDRANQWSLASYTVVNKGGPASASGTITSVQMHAESGHDLANCVVGIFYTTNGDTLKCRSAVAIGAVTGGSVQTFPGLSLAVEVGDYIGIYFTDGWLSRDTGGSTQIWYVDGQYIDPDDETNYTATVDDAISLHGTGVEPVGLGGNMAAKMIAEKLI